MLTNVNTLKPTTKAKEKKSYAKTIFSTNFIRKEWLKSYETLSLKRRKESKKEIMQATKKNMWKSNFQPNRYTLLEWAKIKRNHTLTNRGTIEKKFVWVWEHWEKEKKGK